MTGMGLKKHLVALILPVVTAFVTHGARLTAPDVSLDRGESVSVPIGIALDADNNLESVAGLQFDLSLPDDFSLEAVNASLSSSTGISVTHSLLADKTYKVLIYGDASHPVVGADSPAVVDLVFKCSESAREGSHELRFSNALISDGEAREMPLDDITSALIVEIGKSLVTAVRVEPRDCPNDICNLQGVCLKRNASQDDIDALAPGLYIIAGEKVLVK